jgi:hypothetical protein
MLSIVINSLIFPGTAHVHSKVTQAEVISKSQATEASGETAPETLEV